MHVPRKAPELLEHEFLPIRAKILEVAAALDRLDRAGGSLARDPRMGQIRAALEILVKGGPSSGEGGRAEAVQLLFSLPYDADWWNRLDMDELRAG